MTDQQLILGAASVAENLQVDPLAGTSILSIRYSDTTALAAAAVVTAIVESYRSYLKTTEHGEHHEMLQLLSTREEKLRGELEQLRADFENLTTERLTAKDVRPQSSASSRVLITLADELSETRNRLSRLENVARLLSSSNDQTRRKPAPEITSLDETHARLALDELIHMSNEGWLAIDNPVKVQEKLWETRRTESELQATFGPQHARMVAVRHQISALEEQLLQLANSAPELMRRVADSLQRKKTELEKQYAEHVESGRLHASMELKETQKLDEIKRAQNTYDSTVADLRQWQLADQAVANGRSGIAVTLLEEPAPIERSFAANPLIVLGVAGFVGLISSVVLLASLSRFKPIAAVGMSRPSRT